MEIGIVKPIKLEDEMKGAYLDYAMSVITARALPDVRDGLKPVQRRILYAMDELGLHHNTPYKKSARIVGEVLGKYHPHGDSAVYDAMVRMAQNFSMRYLLVDGQGNFGSIDGDPAAAMRYTEARLAEIAEEMLDDIEKNTVDFVPNFDDSLKEPSVLPAKLPNLLLNGASGIAVGMATNIPPHNLGEIIDATTLIINRFARVLEAGMPFDLLWARVNQSKLDNIAIQEILSKLTKPLATRVDEEARKIAAQSTEDQHSQALIAVLDDMIAIEPDELTAIVKGPDFPTAGIIIGEEGIKNAYATGHGRITIRAKAHVEDMKGARQQIVVTELPYQVNKASLLEKIAELVREKRIESISELRDESDRQGMRIVIELKRDADTKKLLNQLYKYTAMQGSFSINMLALVDGQPRVLNLKMLLTHYIKFRRQVVTRRTEYDLEKARHRAHILEGLKIALDNLDAVIATIRRSASADVAKTALMKNFKLSEIQAQAILDMQLRRLAALERKKIIDEYKEVLKTIAFLEDLLASPAKILYVIRDELAELKTKYGDARRTRIISEEKVDFTEEDLIADQELSVALTAKGYVKRIPIDTYRLRKGTKSTPAVKEDDPVMQVVLTNILDNLLVFTNRGRVLQARVRDLPEAGNKGRGLPLSNYVTLDERERVVRMIPARTIGDTDFAVLATRGGEVKRVIASEYSSIRSSGLITMTVADGDDVIGIELTKGRSDLVLVTAQGQALRLSEDTIRPSGRTSGGIRGMKLGTDDVVVSLSQVQAEGHLTVFTQNGFAKRMVIEEFPTQGRAGGGVRAATIGPKNGPLVAGYVALISDNLVITTAEGLVLKVIAEEVPSMNRGSQGAATLGVEKNDSIVAVSRLDGKDGNEPTQVTPTGTTPNGTALNDNDSANKPSDKTSETNTPETKASAIQEIDESVKATTKQKKATPKGATTTDKVKTPAKEKKATATRLISNVENPAKAEKINVVAKNAEALSTITTKASKGEKAASEADQSTLQGWLSLDEAPETTTKPQRPVTPRSSTMAMGKGGPSSAPQSKPKATESKGISSSLIGSIADKLGGKKAPPKRPLR